MLNATVRAATTGLSSVLFDRRRMLLGLAAASTAAAAPVALASEGSTSEIPELIELGDMTETIADAYRAAQERMWAIYSEWDPKLPAVPPEIKFRRNSFDERGQWEKRLDGLPRNWDDNDRTGLLSVENAERQVRWTRENIARPNRCKSASGLARHEKFLVSQRVKLRADEKALKLARKYHAEFERVVKASGIKVARECRTAAENAMNAHITSVMKHEPRTMTGVMIQAQAIEATNHMPAFATVLEGTRERWAARLATAIIRIAGSAA